MTMEYTGLWGIYIYIIFENTVCMKMGGTDMWDMWSCYFQKSLWSDTNVQGNFVINIMHPYNVLSEGWATHFSLETGSEFEIIIHKPL